jgi:hypothetical protein
MRRGIGFAAVEVEQHHFVSGVGIAGDGAAAAAFRITGMAAGHDHPELARGR